VPLSPFGSVVFCHFDATVVHMTKVSPQTRGWGWTNCRLIDSKARSKTSSQIISREFPNSSTASSPELSLSFDNGVNPMAANRITRQRITSHTHRLAIAGWTVAAVVGASDSCTLSERPWERLSLPQPNSTCCSTCPVFPTESND
jgi:hypothetical protein